MKTSQEKVWDNIAKEWNEFKQTPSETATEFLNNSSGKILDFGSGSGRNLLKIKKDRKKEFYLVDFSQEMLNLAEERSKELGIKIIAKKASLEKIDFPDEFFDSAICVAAIHCIETKEKRKKALKELFRVLKKGAKAEIEVWNKDSPRFRGEKKERKIKWRDKGERYYYLYDEKELQELLESVGFKILGTKPHSANLIFIVEK
ncbi:class I SAM-dependent methyltransferase [Candidatus Pacearchaeota archaeon]|nr:class I SAM-dependent methyltransferase [Candidatus Pacearchaeota archaeon]